MRIYLLIVGVMACIVLLDAKQTAAETVTFGSSNIDLLINEGVQTEGTVEYQATVGDGWEIVNAAGRGNPPSALVTFFSGPLPNAVGDKVEFVLVGGGLFQFLSVDTRVNSDPASSDLVQFIGTQNGNFVGAISPSATSRYTTAFGFSGAIDKLTIEVTKDGSNAFWIDNLKLVSLPEPSTLGLLAIGALTMLRRRSA